MLIAFGVNSILREKLMGPDVYEKGPPVHTLLSMQSLIGLIVYYVLKANG